ncbi:MAG: hypothetical protein P0116_16005, partial [Candidatus Nitrosocosmicus sp.]|nr:hypothetical protein [Candidatus Nitrosocosmicus sp.]
VHEDKNVDIIVFSFFPDSSIYDFKYIKSELVVQKVDLENRGIVEGIEVFFPGLFKQYLGYEKIQPILRFGRLSSLPEERIHIKEEDVEIEGNFYLIECTSFSGNSGSPVFFKINKPGGFSLFLGGLITASFHENKPLGSDAILIQNTGVALVTPSYRLTEILYSRKVLADRQKMI